jgi:hypothetical protein
LKADAINRWLTLGANLGVLVGIFLLIAELNQNSTLMRAQIFNDRAGHGIALFGTDKLTSLDKSNLADFHQATAAFHSLNAPILRFR